MDIMNIKGLDLEAQAPAFYLFKFHKAGYLPWKHKKEPQRAENKNLGVDEHDDDHKYNDQVISDSKN